jgi:hypothetical protein
MANKSGPKSIRTSNSSATSYQPPVANLPFDSFFHAARAYLDFISILLSESGTLAPLVEERKALADLERVNQATWGPSTGAECFELAKQLVYQELRPVMDAELKRRNAELQRLAKIAKNNNGWSHAAKKETVLILYNKANGRKGERIKQIREAIARNKREWKLTLSPRALHALIAELRTEGRLP